MKKKVKETGILLSEDTAELAYHVEVRKSFWAKVRYGAAATVFTVVFIALMIGLNLLVGLASERFPLQLDLTEEQLFTVSDETVEYLQQLEYDVEFIVLGDEANWRSYSTSASSGSSSGLGVSVHKYIVETLDRYAEVSGHVKLYYVDYNYNPEFFKERNNLPVTDDLGDDPVLIVYSPDTGRYRFIRNSLFQDSQYLALENRLNTGIRYTTNPDMKKIAVISGHSERNLAYFKAVMEDDGYMVNTLELTTVDKIPDDYQIIVICNPTRQYSASDISKIDAFLSNNELEGKSMMVFADLDYCNSDTELRNYLEEWGIALQDECIYDPQNSTTLTGANATFKVNYSDEASAMTGTLSSGNFKLNLQLGKTRALKKLFDQQDDVEVYSLLQSSETSFSRFQVSSRNDFSGIKKQEGDTSGPFDVGLLALRNRYDGLSRFATSVAVFGSTSLVDDYFISNVDSENQATQEYMAQLVHFMAAQSEDGFSHIPTVSLLTDGLKFENDGQITAVWVVSAVAIPACFLVCGLLIWRRRKHL
ncbi:MAG: GldG family protein [Clostridia bacterium]|nr:GldG family protein [Clostridia bacterium]